MCEFGIVGHLLTFNSKSYVRYHAKNLLGTSDHLPPHNDLGRSQVPEREDSFFSEPRIDRLTIDFDLPGVSPWTLRAATLFEADFLREFRLGSFTCLRELPPPGKVAEAFINHVLYLKAMYREEKRTDATVPPDLLRKARARKRTRRERVRRASIHS